MNTFKLFLFTNVHSRTLQLNIDLKYLCFKVTKANCKMCLVWIKLKPGEQRLSQRTINTLAYINVQQITIQPEVHETKMFDIDIRLECEEC